MRTKGGRPPRFTPEQQAEICIASLLGISHSELARSFNCSRNTVFKVINKIKGLGYYE